MRHDREQPEVHDSLGREGLVLAVGSEVRLSRHIDLECEHVMFGCGEPSAPKVALTRARTEPTS